MISYLSCFGPRWVLSLLCALATALLAASPLPAGENVPPAVVIRALCQARCPVTIDGVSGYPVQDAPCQRATQNPFFALCGWMAIGPEGQIDYEQNCINVHSIEIWSEEAGYCSGTPCYLILDQKVDFIERCIGSLCLPRCCGTVISGAQNGYPSGEVIDPSVGETEFEFGLDEHSCPCPQSNKACTISYQLRCGSENWVSMAQWAYEWHCGPCADED